MEGGHLQLPSASLPRTPSDDGAPAVDFDGLLEQLLSGDGDGSFPEGVNWLASPLLPPDDFDFDFDFDFEDDATATLTNTTPAGDTSGCVEPRGARPSPVDSGLLEQQLSGDNARSIEVASPSPISMKALTRSPPPGVFFPADYATSTPIATTPAANASRRIQTGRELEHGLERLFQARSYIQETLRDGDAHVLPWTLFDPRDAYQDGYLELTLGRQLLPVDTDSCLSWFKASTKYLINSSQRHTQTLVWKDDEWSGDVEYFTSYEEFRTTNVQNLALHGCTGLPIFEKGSYYCLGFIELIVTRHWQKFDFTSELNTICSALQAIDLRTTEVSSIPRIKVTSAPFNDALQEILVVLKAACVIHMLPLAQTWVKCAQHGKWGSRHSHQNYQYCISTIDEACCVNEDQMRGFHEACSEHHLLQRQGVAGMAFTTNQLCFLSDIGSSMDYPLSHHARSFNLKGAAAVRLRSTRTGNADFVLEFFLPTDCQAPEEQMALLDSLSGTIQIVGQTLRVVTDKEMREEEVAGEASLQQQQQQQASTSVNRPKSRNSVSLREKSKVWKYFKRLSPKGADVVEAECFQCHKTLKNRKGGTSSLWRHVKSHRASAATTQDAAPGSQDHVTVEIAAMMDLVVEAGAEEGSDEYYYATQLLIKKKYRDGFHAMKTPDLRLGWLRWMLENRKKN